MLVPMTLADSRHVKTLTELSASGVGDYSDPQKLKLIISDAFTEQMMQWTDMLTKADCNVGPHTQTRTLVRKAFGKIGDMLERYAEAGKECYAEECYPGTLHWIRLLDPDSFRLAELEETSDWFRCHLPKIVNDAAAPGVGQVKEEVLETAEEEFCPENMQPLENCLLRSKVARTLLKQMRERMEATEEIEA